MDYLEMYGKKDIVTLLTGMSGEDPIIDGNLCTVWSDGWDAVILYINPEIPILSKIKTEGHHYSYIWKLEYYNNGKKVLEKDIKMEVHKDKLGVHLSDLREFIDQCRSNADLMDKLSTNKPLEKTK